MMKRSAQLFMLALALVSCREVRGEPDALHEDERDARVVADVTARDASMEAARPLPDASEASDAGASVAMDAATDARPRDAALSSDSSSQPAADAITAADAQGAQSGPYKWYDGTIPPPEGAWPVAGEMTAHVDSGTDPGCMPALGNSQGVGASCWHDTRDQTCINTRTCNEALALRGLAVPSPYYCTRPCREHSDCGKGATCCALPGLDGKACILDGCRYSCR